MKTSRERLREKAVDLLQAHPSGLHYKELHGLLLQELPAIPANTIHGALWSLTSTPHKNVFKPTRGVYKFRPHDAGAVPEVVPPATSQNIREEDFYESFANWLKAELGECTEAVALGGSAMGKKWGTPDVIGIYRPSTRDLIKLNAEITSAEIKINPALPIEAFGQSIAYRLFSAQVYLVEPNTMLEEDKDRIEALCMLFGVGFVLFDLKPKAPDFRIRVRAQRFSPDMFYVNQFAERLFDTREDLFNQLFR
mgnify:CR=1 FL=1